MLTFVNRVVPFRRLVVTRFRKAGSVARSAAQPPSAIIVETQNKNFRISLGDATDSLACKPFSLFFLTVVCFGSLKVESGYSELQHGYHSMRFRLLFFFTKKAVKETRKTERRIVTALCPLASVKRSSTSLVPRCRPHHSHSDTLSLHVLALAGWHLTIMKR